MSHPNPDNVARGLKAAIHNPNVSQEAKERDAQRLQEMGVDLPSDMATSTDVPAHNLRSSPKETTKHHAGGGVAQEGGEMSHHVLGGYKATLANPRTSEGAKHHAEQILEEHKAI